MTLAANMASSKAYMQSYIATWLSEGLLRSSELPTQPTMYQHMATPDINMADRGY